jgi:hypothetical protein
MKLALSGLIYYLVAFGNFDLFALAEKSFEFRKVERGLAHSPFQCDTSSYHKAQGCKIVATHFLLSGAGGAPAS